MKVAADDQLTENPATRFPNNNSFVTYTSVIEPNQPYIVAEISSSRYEVARNFLLGSLNTQMFNDQPGLYFNGPLNQSTSYTVFVWGFSPTPAAVSCLRVCFVESLVYVVLDTLSIIVCTVCTLNLLSVCTFVVCLYICCLFVHLLLIPCSSLTAECVTC